MRLASEYLKWKYRDVKPQAPHQMTPRERRANWWHYHKWHVLAGAVLLLCLAHIGYGGWVAKHRGPELQIAYVGAAPLPDETVAALEEAIAAIGANCGGPVTCRVNQYLTTDPSGRQDTALYAYGSAVTLMADLQSCDSYLFLLDEPEAFQNNYQILRHLDGSLPEEGAKQEKAFCLSWADCPVLTGLPLGDYEEIILGQQVTGSNQSLFSGLYLARRGFWTDRTSHDPEGCERLWNALTEGAGE